MIIVTALYLLNLLSIWILIHLRRILSFNFDYTGIIIAIIVTNNLYSLLLVTAKTFNNLMGLTIWWKIATNRTHFDFVLMFWCFRVHTSFNTLSNWLNCWLDKARRIRTINWWLWLKFHIFWILINTISWRFYCRALTLNFIKSTNSTYLHCVISPKTKFYRRKTLKRLITRPDFTFKKTS